MLLVIAVMNLIVGTLVGVSGIAGFLLPIVFTGYLGMDLSLSLALSFISFLTSGIIGSYRYQAGTDGSKVWCSGGNRKYRGGGARRQAEFYDSSDYR